MKTSDLAFNTVCAVVILAAVAWFGTGFVIHLYRTEVGKAAMQMRVDDVIDPAERLWILDNIRAELESNHKGDPQLWAMPVSYLVNQPADKFKGLDPGRLGMLRRLYMKLKITNAEG